jgi:hypothetical protein
MEDGLVYRAPISLIWEKGFQFSRGHGTQIGLRLKYWNLENEAGAKQLQLWGGEHVNLS